MSHGGRSDSNWLHYTGESPIGVVEVVESRLFTFDLPTGIVEFEAGRHPAGFGLPGHLRNGATPRGATFERCDAGYLGYRTTLGQSIAQ
jgi:hypothetical protein